MISNERLDYIHLSYLTNTLLVCSFAFNVLFADMDNRLLVILGHDKTENAIFGVSKNGKAILKSTEDHSARFNAVAQNEWLGAKEKSTTTHTKWLESDLAITNTTITPQAGHTVTSTSGTMWGGKS